jgi:hypothetical protein
MASKSTLMASTAMLMAYEISLTISTNTFKISTIILTAYSSTLKPENNSFPAL